MSRRTIHSTITWLGGLIAFAAASSVAAQTGGGEEGELPEPSKLEADSEEGSDSNSPDRLPPAEELARESPTDTVGEGPPAEAGENPPRKLPPDEDGAEGSLPPVEDDGEPPVQVRRAVETVEASAKSVAGAVAEGRLSGAHSGDGAEGGGEERPALRRLPREGSESEESSEEVADSPERGPSADEIFAEMRRLFRETGGSVLALDPHVDDPRWERAMQLLVEDDCREALDLVDSVVDETKRDLKQIPAVRYAIGRIKMCAGRASDGRETLRALRERDDTVGELARRRLGGSPRPIRPDREEPADWRDRLRRAREKARSGEVSEALAELSELRAGLERAWRRYKVRMTEVNLHLRRGDGAEARRGLVDIYRTARDWSVGDRVARKIERVEERHDLEVLSLGDRIDRMRELIARREFRKAKEVSIENAKRAGVSGEEIEGWSYYRRGLEAEQKRRRGRADELFEKAASRVDSPVIRPRLYFGWARALRRLDRDDEAIDLYGRLCREYPRHHLCDDARFEIGRLHQYDDRHEPAREAFGELLGMHPDSEYVPKALWRGAFSAYLSGEYRLMEKPLRRILREYPERTDASGLPVALKAHYWLGVAALERGETGIAARRLQETINRGALTWYGRLAAARMKSVGAEPVIPRPPRQLSAADLHDLSTLALPDHPRYRIAAEYARLGLYDDAIEEMKRQLDTPPVPEKAHRFLANLRFVDGRRAVAHWSMHDHLTGATPTSGSTRKWGLAYPFAFRESTRRYAAEFGVSRHLVEAVMRQESGFRPEVSSGVGAVGLMQLMPGTANVVADDFFDGSYVSRSELREPHTNIRLGTAYIRAMLARVKGRIPLALAGYNAGPAPLDDWFDRFGERSVDAWVESITYEQARGYVRKVYTSYTRYASLYEGRLPDIRLELPEEFGEWGEAPELQERDVEKPPVSWR